MPKYIVSFDIIIDDAFDIEADSPQEAIDEVRDDWRGYVQKIRMYCREDGVRNSFFNDGDKDD